VSAEGGKEPLRAMLTAFTSGSDHQVYMDGSWRIPSVYLNDWPDRYIHTDKDSAAMIDATKLKRAGFIGAATGYYLARLGGDEKEGPWQRLGEALQLLTEILTGQLRRAAQTVATAVSVGEGESKGRAYLTYERDVLLSVNEFSESWADEEEALQNVLLYPRLQAAMAEEPEKGGPVFARNAEPKGPMSVFGYDYFEDKLGREAARKVRLLSYRGLWGSGDMYAYEVLNFVDGRRSAQEIRDAVSAEFGPVELEMVVEYLRALEKIGVLKEVKK
jgi:hypothetical protein